MKYQVDLQSTDLKVNHPLNSLLFIHANSKGQGSIITPMIKPPSFNQSPKIDHYSGYGDSRFTSFFKNLF